MSKFLTKLYTCNFPDKYLGSRIYFNTCKLSYGSSLLTDYLSVKCTVYNNSLTNFFNFILLKKVATSSL